MKKIFFILALFLVSSCFSSKGPEDPLLLPPNYTELPDPKNPEKIEEKTTPEDVEKLKDLLLKSE